MQLVEERPARPLPIRITPLIDVVFILLVFFMLTSRLLPVDFLELDNQTKTRSAATGEPIPELMIQPDGTLSHDDTRKPVNEMIRQFHSEGIREVNLSTAPEATLNQFTHTLTSLTSAGIESHWKRETAPDTP